MPFYPFSSIFTRKNSGKPNRGARGAFGKPRSQRLLKSRQNEKFALEQLEPRILLSAAPVGEPDSDRQLNDQIEESFVAGAGSLVDALGDLQQVELFSTKLSGFASGKTFAEALDLEDALQERFLSPLQAFLASSHARESGDLNEFLENLDFASQNESFTVDKVHGGHYDNLGGYEYRMLLGVERTFSDRLEGGSDASAYGFDVSGLEFDATASLSFDLSLGLDEAGVPESFYARFGDLDFGLAAKVEEGGITIESDGTSYVTKTETPLTLDADGEVTFVGDWLKDGIASKSELDSIDSSNASTFFAAAAEGEMLSELPFVNAEDGRTYGPHLRAGNVFLGDDLEISSSIDLTQRETVKKHLVDVLELVGGWSDDLSQDGRLNQVTPGFDRSLNDLLGGSGSIARLLDVGGIAGSHLRKHQNDFFNDLAWQLRQKWVEPAGELPAWLSSHVPRFSGGYDEVRNRLLLDFSFTPRYGEEIPFLGSLPDELGISLNTDSGALMDVSGEFVLRIVIDLTKASPSADDVWIELAGDHAFRFNLSATLRAEDLGGVAHFEGLPLELSGGEVRADLALGMTLPNANHDDRLTLAEMQASDFSPLVSPSGSLQYNLPLAGNLNGVPLDSSKLPTFVFTDTDFFDGSAPTVQASNLADLQNAATKLAEGSEVVAMEALSMAGSYLAGIDDLFASDPLMKEALPGTNLSLAEALAGRASPFGLCYALLDYSNQQRFSTQDGSASASPTLADLERYLKSNWLDLLGEAGHGLALTLTADSLAIAYTGNVSTTRSVRARPGKKLEDLGVKVDGDLDLDCVLDADYVLTASWAGGTAEVDFSLDRLSFTTKAETNQFMGSALVGPVELSAGTADGPKGEVAIDFGLSATFDGSTFDLTPSGTLDFTLPLQGLLFGKDFLGIAGVAPKVLLSGNPYPADGQAGLVASLADFGPLSKLRTLTLGDILENFDEVSDWISEFDEGELLDYELPLINLKLGDALDFANGFKSGVLDDVSDPMEVQNLGDLSSALSLSSFALSSQDFVFDPAEATLAIPVHFDHSGAPLKDLPLYFDLNFGDDSFSLDVEALADLATSVRARFDLVFDLDGPSGDQGLAVFVDNLSLEGDVRLDVEDLSAKAKLAFLSTLAGGKGSGSGVHLEFEAGFLLDDDGDLATTDDRRFSLGNLLDGSIAEKLRLRVGGEAVAKLKDLSVEGDFGGLSFAPDDEIVVTFGGASEVFLPSESTASSSVQKPGCCWFRGVSR